MSISGRRTTKKKPAADILLAANSDEHYAVPNARGRFAVNALIAVILLAGLVPLARMLWLLFTTGGNCIGNDHVFWVDTIDGALAGKLTPLQFASQCLIGTHYCLLQILIET
ncbi:MAG: hypothetical protein ACRD3W_27100 [Terriglobales bacterium]